MDFWKDNFEEHILMRGEDYYYSGAVENLKKTSEGYEAQVEGSELYQVEIHLSGGTVMDMYCSCPYAEKGKNCKHMAAVLYQVENELAWNNCYEQTDIKSLIKGLTKEQLSEFLLNLAETDTKIKNQLLMKYSSSFNSSDVSRLKREVDAIVEKYMGWDAYIDYYHALDFSDELIGFIYDKMNLLIERNFNLQAFELINYIFLSLANVEIDDSDGGISQAMDTCCEAWKKILQNSNDVEKEQIHKWFQNRKANGQDLDYFQDYIDDFLMNEFHDEELLKERMAEIDDMLQKSEAKGQISEKVWDFSNGFRHPVIIRLDIMKQLGYPEDEILAYRKKYRKVPEVRKLEILEAIDKGKLDKAVLILLESKETDKKENNLVSWYSEKLIELYEKLDMQKEYKKELLFYIMSSYQESLEYVYKLKNRCTLDEWISCREKILQHMPVLTLRYELMKNEKMYDRLMQELVIREDIYNVDRYESLLKNKFPEKLVGLYRDYLKREVQTTHSRETYRQMMMYLKKIASYPEGMDTAQQLALQWKKLYHRRSAMMDELRKAGF